MRLIQVFVPSNRRSAVAETLKAADVEFLFGDERSGRDGVIAYVPVPRGAVDAVLERIHDAGVPEDTYTVVTDAERATVPNTDVLTDRFVEGPEGESALSHPEIRERAEDLKPARRTYVLFATLSAVVAVGGLLLDSAVIIVGAMVIAPFAGSALSVSVGAVISDYDMVAESVQSQLLGLAVAFAGAVGMSLLFKLTSFVPSTLALSRIDQVSAFSTPTLLTLFIALAAGFAGALALATDLPVSIAGVAVAAAIVPAAAGAGLGVVWGELLLVLGAVVLLSMNILLVNVAAYVGLVSLGYRSSVLRSLREDLELSLRTGAYAAVTLAFVVVVVLTAVATYQHVAFQQEVNRNVQSVLSNEEYERLELVRVETEYSDVDALGRTEGVTVTVARSTETDYPALAARIRGEIGAATGRAVTVNVHFRDYQQSSPLPDGRLHGGRLGGVDRTVPATLTPGAPRR
jgi:uncharacterized hydrophobic protein (TIGR00341 family)